jgi:hypothetical protein
MINRVPENRADRSAVQGTLPVRADDTKETPDMRFKIAALIAASLAGTVAAQDFDSRAVNADCAADWPNDFAMQQYCHDQRAASFDEFNRLRETAKATDGFDMAVLPKCVDDWAPDWTMVAFCTEQNIEAVANFKAALAILPDGLMNEIKTACENDWPADHNMQAYCADQQADAWRSMQ